MVVTNSSSILGPERSLLLDHMTRPEKWATCSTVFGMMMSKLKFRPLHLTWRAPSWKAGSDRPSFNGVEYGNFILLLSTCCQVLKTMRRMMLISLLPICCPQSVRNWRLAGQCFLTSATFGRIFARFCKNHRQKFLTFRCNNRPPFDENLYLDWFTSSFLFQCFPSSATFGRIFASIGIFWQVNAFGTQQLAQQFKINNQTLFFR